MTNNDIILDLMDLDDIGLTSSAPTPAEELKESAANTHDAQIKTETHSEAGAIPSNYFRCDNERR